MKYFFLFLCITWITFSCSHHLTEPLENDVERQLEINLQPDEWSSLPDEIEESSGLDVFRNQLITINDSGGEPVIYFLNEEGKITKRFRLPGTENVDWEDIAADDESMYVGEFGNNFGKRTDLNLIRVKQDSVTHFPFSYADQQKFGFKVRATPYDCESVFVMDNRLWLLTKDWDLNTTQLYELNKDTVKQQLQPVGKYGADLLITGADYSEENQILICSGYKNFTNYLLVFPEFTPANTFQTPPLRIHLKGLFNAQVEGICFYKDSILFSTEKTVLFPQQIWSVDLHTSEIASYLENNT